MPRQIFMNKVTGRLVAVIKVEGNYVRVQYDVSNHRSWFDVEDFKRIFTQVV